MKKNILILGGSSSIAKELAELHNNDNRYYSYHSTVDNAHNAFFLNLYDLQTYENIPLKPYDIIYSFLGYTPDVNLINDIKISKATIERNFLYPTLVLQYILQNHPITTNTKIKIITSVAGIRGRKLNYVYGASKSGLQTLIEGLANKYPDIRFTDIVLGPVLTDAVPIHNTPSFLISNPKTIALTIKRAKKQKVYLPFKWKPIMLIIRAIPTSIYNRLSI